IGEAPLLTREVMDGIEKWRRVFDALVGLEITAGEEVLHTAEAVGRRGSRRFCRQSGARVRTIGAKRAAIFKAWLYPFAAAEVVIDAAGIVENVLARREVDKCRWCAARIRPAARPSPTIGCHKIGIQNTAETADAVRQKNAVDAILRVGMVVANVEQTARR